MVYAVPRNRAWESRAHAAAAHGVKTPVLEERQDLTQKTIETAVRKGVDIMPRFRKTEITDADLAAIVAYLTHK